MLGGRGCHRKTKREIGMQKLIDINEAEREALRQELAADDYCIERAMETVIARMTRVIDEVTGVAR